MLIKDVFKEIIVGYNITNSTTKNDYAKRYKTLQKDSIQYTNIIKDKLIEKNFTSEVKDKYFMKPRDILIFVKRPYRVGTYTYGDNIELVIPNNFIVLRNIDMNKYSYIFVANYLEKVIMEKFKKDNTKKGNLSIGEIEDIELPDISKDKQMTISPLLKSINKRSAIYSNILENDDKIIRYAINSIVGDIDE